MENINAFHPLGAVIAKRLPDRNPRDESVDLHRRIGIHARGNLVPVLHFQQQAATLHLRWRDVGRNFLLRRKRPAENQQQRETGPLPSLPALKMPGDCLPVRARGTDASAWWRRVPFCYSTLACCLRSARSGSS
jgi:hypothetical protein